MQVDPTSPPIPSPALRPPANRTQEAAQDFEAQVLGVLLQPMFAGLDGKGPFGGGAAEAQWQPLLVQEFGRAIAAAGGLGIADAVRRDMERSGG